MPWWWCPGAASGNRLRPSHRRPSSQSVLPATSSSRLPSSGAAAAGARLHGLDGAGISLAMRVATTMLMTPSYNNTVAGGTTLTISADGPDERDAVEALVQLVQTGFGEATWSA